MDHFVTHKYPPSETSRSCHEYQLRPIMITDYRHYRQILSRLKRPTLSIISGRSRNSSTLSLDSFIAYGLGSGPNGQLMCQLPCSNKSASFVCDSIGLMECSQCLLVKYCSGRCQRQHWAKHRIDCEGPFIQSDWQPDWVAQKRKPIFSVPRTLIPSSTSPDVFKNPGCISYDCLRLHLNEGSQAAEQNFKLCMTSVSDIRNLVETVNSLPTNYRGRIDILMNNSNAIAINRMLVIYVILCALLTPGPSIDESAELATHLMYSISLPETAASYLRFCVNQIYGEEPLDGEMSFQASLKTRGQGRIYSAQPSVSIKKPVEMFTSTYKRSKAFESYRAAMQDPFRIDDRHKALSDLQPAHRLSLNRFWKTGILLPFSVDLSPFSCPNRLMFTAQGEWMGPNDITSPLYGWDINAVSQTSIRHGVESSADIIGALFFHIKAEFREFSLRIKEHDINIHITQYDSHLLSKGISIGLFPSFSDASFDRIDIGDMSDTVGVAECLTDWGPLLNKKNPHSTLLLHSKRWHEEIPGAVARENPRALEILLERCKGLSSPSSSMKAIFNGHEAQSPSVLRLVTSLDAFIDHESAFTQYLEIKEVNLTGISLGLTLRKVHGVHPKRVGIPLQLAEQRLPNMTKEAFYETFIAGGADLTIRFAEFAHTASNDDTSTSAGDLKVHQDKDTYTDIRTSEKEMVIDFGSWNPGM